MNTRKADSSDTAMAAGTQAGRPYKWCVAGAIALLALGVRAPLLSRPGFIGDQGQFLVWSAMSKSQGLSSVYELRPDGSGKHWCNYPPGYVYVLRVLAGVYPALAGRQLDASVIEGFAARDGSSPTRWAAALYKLPAAMADAVLGVVLLLLLAKRMGLRWAGAIAVLYVLMPAVIHDSTVWGQVDAIPTLLTVASLEMARRRRLTWMAGLAMLAVLTKPQAAIMAPIWAMVALVHLRRDWRGWAHALMAAAAVGVALLLPFGNVSQGVWQSFAGAAKYYPFTHLNGFSVWFLSNPLLAPHLGDPLAGRSWQESLYAWYVGDDLPLVFGITARGWGLLGVACVGAYSLARLWRGRCDERSLGLVARLLPLAFFVLSTQMHERYLYPAVAIWAWAAIPSRRWLICWLLLGACASINVLWTWSGPSGAFWTKWCDVLLHRSWLGATPGVWCSLVLCCLLALTAAGWVDAARAKATSGEGRRRQPTQAV